MFERLDLKDKRIIVTGASSGIGRALAEQLAERKARVVLAARSRERLEDLASRLRASGGDVYAIPTDVADAAQRQRLVEETVRVLGGLDVLINNAGVGASGAFATASEGRLRRVFEVNFFSAAELTRLALPHLFLGRQPMIVNVSSVIGRRGVPGYSEYCASKFAMCGWSESLRAELLGRGVHVLLVCPGLIETEFRNNLLEDRLASRAERGRRMSAARCARAIIEAMRKRRNEVVITTGGKVLVWLNRLAPGLVDWGMARWLGTEE